VSYRKCTGASLISTSYWWRANYIEQHHGYVCRRYSSHGNRGDCWKFNQKTAICCKQSFYLDKNGEQNSTNPNRCISTSQIRRLDNTHSHHWYTSSICQHKKISWDDELNIKFRKMYWLLGRNYELSFHNKITLYKQVIRPVWSYGIQLWGCASDSNTEVIQLYQNKVLKCTVNAPWHVRNSGLHRDLGIETVTDIITTFANFHEKRPHQHRNVQTS
jgi:hypothetical protein